MAVCVNATQVKNEPPITCGVLCASKVEPSTPLKKVFSPPRCEAHVLCVCSEKHSVKRFRKAQPSYCGDVVDYSTSADVANNLEVRVPRRIPQHVFKSTCVVMSVSSVCAGANPATDSMCSLCTKHKSVSPTSPVELVSPHAVKACDSAHSCYPATQT